MKVSQQTRRFFSRHPVYPVYSVREASVCSMKGQRPTLTTRHGSTRVVHANTQKSGLFWFPGRYPGPPLSSPVTLPSLSLFLLSLFLIRPYSPSRGLLLSLSPSPHDTSLCPWNLSRVPKWGLTAEPASDVKMCTQNGTCRISLFANDDNDFWPSQKILYLKKKIKMKDFYAFQIRVCVYDIKNAN